jgi:RimJ/RimL family protein N-acetyltransferase
MPVTIVLAVPRTTSAAALRLRPWRSQDLLSLLAAHRDPSLRQWLTTPLVEDADARDWLDAQAAGWAAGTRFSFAIVADDGAGVLLGHVMVRILDAGVGTVGYWTAAHARGRGVAARALATLSWWALEDQDMTDLTRLDLVHAEDNHASCRVAEKCGFALRELLPAAPPAHPGAAHRHIRTGAEEYR